jgi:segregation and condensation protein A
VSLPRRADPPTIRLEEFEGPLELLLSLVERRRLPIAEMSLVAVADQYLAQVRELEQVHPDLLSAFLAMAARLLLLKSRALLPAIDVPDPASNADEPESAEELLRRLEVYRAFRTLAAELGNLDSAGRSAYSGGAHAFDDTGTRDVLDGVAPAMLASLIIAIERRQAAPTADEGPAPPRRATVAERLALLRSILSTRRVIAWDEVAGVAVDEIVATLLAVLEMVRRGELAVVQANLFGPIRLQALDRRPVPLGDDAGDDQSELTYK